MNADAKLDPTFRRQAGVALDHASLHFDRAAHGVDHAPELDDRAVAGALHNAPVMHRDDGVDEIAAERPQARKDTILVRACEPAVSDDVRDQDRRELSGLAHCAPGRRKIGTKNYRPNPGLLLGAEKVNTDRIVALGRRFLVPTYAFCRRPLSRLPPVQGADLVGQLRVDLTRSPSRRRMTAICVRREKAALSSGCKAHPATAPAGSNRSSHGGDEMAEAFGVAGHI